MNTASQKMSDLNRAQPSSAVPDLLALKTVGISLNSLVTISTAMAMLVFTTLGVHAATIKAKVSEVTPLENSEPVDVASYQRIISAGGSITEILNALGLMPKVVAVDTSSLYPAETAQLPKVGYFRSLGAEGLLSLSPDIIVAARGAGPAAVLDQVRTLGVPVKQFEQSIYTLDSWQRLVNEIGHFFGKETQSLALTQQVLGNIKRAQAQMGSSRPRINAMMLMNSGQRGPTVAGKNTVPDLLMSLAGINNLAGDIEGFKPFSAELLASQRVDLMLVPNHTIESMGGVEGVCANSAIKLATQQGCNVVVMDALLLLGFGARIDQAVLQVIERAVAL